MKLKLAILSAFALTSANAMTPCVSVKLGGGYANSCFKAEHKFKNAVEEKKTEGTAAKKDGDKAETKNDDEGTASEAGHGFNGIVAVDVAFAKEQFMFGLRGGAAFLGASPSIEGKQKANVLKADQKTAFDEALAEADNAVEKTRIESDYSVEKAPSKFEEKDVAYSIKADKGMMYFVGPFGGMNINEKMSADLGVLFTMRKLCLTIKEGDNAETLYEHKMNYGIMPSITGSYKFTDMISGFVSVGYNMNLSSLEAKEEKSSDADKKADADKKTTENKDCKITKASAGNVLLVSAGVSVKVM